MIDIKEHFSSFELPPDHQKEENKKKLPFFCTRCEEIRGEEGKGTVMNNHHEELMWRSFGMCSACYLVWRDYPDKVILNQKRYQEKLDLKKKKAEEEVRLRRFRVYFLDNERFPNSDFVNSISEIKFRKFPNFHKQGLATSSKELVKKEQAEKTVELLISKDLVSWYEEDRPSQIEKTNTES